MTMYRPMATCMQNNIDPANNKQTYAKEKGQYVMKTLKEFLKSIGIKNAGDSYTRARFLDISRSTPQCSDENQKKNFFTEVSSRNSNRTKEGDQINFNQLAGNNVQIFLPFTIDGFTDPNQIKINKDKPNATKVKNKHLLHPVQKRLNQRRINMFLSNMTPKPQQALLISGENMDHEADPQENFDSEELLITNW